MLLQSSFSVEKVGCAQWGSGHLGGAGLGVPWPGEFEFQSSLLEAGQGWDWERSGFSRTHG